VLVALLVLQSEGHQAIAAVKAAPGSGRELLPGTALESRKPPPNHRLSTCSPPNAAGSGRCWNPFFHSKLPASEYAATTGTDSPLPLSRISLLPTYHVREGGSLIAIVRDPGGYRVELIERG
jgi:hypothetical protein